MINRRITIFVLLIVANIWSADTVDTLKIVTFNLFSKPNSNWSIRLTMILDEFEKISPDIIGLQEVVETPGHGGIDNRAKIIADSLSKRTGIEYDYYWQKTHFSWDTYDEGIAIITRHKTIGKNYINLPTGIFNRKSIMARVATPISEVEFYNTHLSYGDQRIIRESQIETISEFIQQNRNESEVELSILVGDFNADNEEVSIKQLIQGDSTNLYFYDCWVKVNPYLNGNTYPSTNPMNRIDYIFVVNNQAYMINKSEIIFNTPNDQGIYPSDHLGILTVLSKNK